MMALSHTPTALKRWSCQDRQLPSVDKIKAIHVYDFDNTLFKSPLPNRQVWNTGTCGSLQAQEFLHNGGWWHNPSILAATGGGLEKEEARAWEGCWNESIVQLVQLSMAEEDALTVLLTGRQEQEFADLIGRMVQSKGLVFDMVCLKPSSGPNGEVFGSTMLFKQALLRDIVYTYYQAEELRIYEDRIKHTKGFRDFFADFNKTLMAGVPTAQVPVPRQPITAEVIQVTEQDSFMDPVSEVAEVQKMINVHNRAILDGAAPRNAFPYKIKRSVFYTGYLIEQADIDRLRSLVRPPQNCPEHELKHLANNILITPRPAPHSILNKVGGIGAKMRWRVTGLAVYEQRVWAARVQPVPANAKVYTENATPCVVLATRRQAKPIEASRIQNWQPVPDHQAFEFESTVGEKVLLRIEQEYSNEDEYEASFPNAKNAKKHPREEDFPPLGASRQHGNKPAKTHQGGRGGFGGNRNDGTWVPKQNGNNFNNAPRGGGAGSSRGARGNFAPSRGRRDARGGGARGRGGGGRGGYKSLDDNVGQGYGSGGMQY
ncbi:hypothetical protein CBER1_04255 [Cercospora berteroae]|uniref:Swiss Army Knife RNA repair protein HAD domain-containing protein n=1 Tax=Cercospora berteroae TaxID=357750 RepID=A0A2S6CHQ3_9PEZI|nr:hypothetical protein CBER1_04255 [Cercospora berteroae]